MGNYGDDRPGGGDRWRDRSQGYRDRDYGGGDDRGFFDRAGDEVRSWFGDDEAQRRREMDERRWEQEQRMSGRRDNDPRSGGSGPMGGGWGNQRGESWNRDRPGEREGWFSSSVGGERGERWGGARQSERDYGDGPGFTETWGNDRVAGGTSGFGGYPDHGRRFDRIDPGHVGTLAAHPMSAPVGGGYGGGSGITEGGGYGSSARYAAMTRGGGGTGGGDIHDPHYSEWRRRQIEDLDRDYDEYRREHQSKFEAEFGGWREKRRGQRQLLGRVSEHMEVDGSDGSYVGTVDKVRGDRIILAKSDPNAGGMHHSVPCGWVEAVEDKVI